MIGGPWLATLLIAVVSGRPLTTETSPLSREDRKLLEWFNALGYAPNLANAPLVRITILEDKVESPRDAGGAQLGFLLSERDGRLTVLVLSLATSYIVPSLEHRQNTELFKTVTSNALGQFVISGIRPDDYKLLAWDKIPLGASQNASFVAKYESQGSTVKVEAGSKMTAEVLLLLQGSAK